MTKPGGHGDQRCDDEGRTDRTEAAVIEGYVAHDGSRRLDVSYLTSSGTRFVESVLTERTGEVVIHVRLQGPPGGRRFFDVRRRTTTVMLREPLRDRRVVDERGRRVKPGMPRSIRGELLD